MRKNIHRWSRMGSGDFDNCKGNVFGTMRETRVQFLGWEDPLEKEMAIHSSILVWRIPWREEPSRLQSAGLQSRTRLSNFTLPLKDCHSSSVSRLVMSDSL